MLMSTTLWLCLAVPAVPLAWRLTGRAVYAYLVRTTTVLPFLEGLGRSRADGKFSGNALVAGGRCVC
jgi:hypothetical protein